VLLVRHCLFEVFFLSFSFFFRGYSFESGWSDEDELYSLVNLSLFVEEKSLFLLPVYLGIDSAVTKRALFGKPLDTTHCLRASLLSNIKDGGIYQDK